jgi:ADP-ribosylglycohydrolase
VVGALAGAAYGYQSIPDRWRTALRCEWPIASNQYFVTVDFSRIALQLAGID